MGEETAPFINSLNAAWPLSTDLIRYGAVHLRTIKSSVKATFPNLTGAMTRTHTELNNAAIKTAANVFTSVASGLNAAIILESSNPGIMFKKTTAATDEKNWRIAAALEELRMELVNDAGDTIDYFFRANRNEMVMSLIEFITTRLRITGVLETTGVIELGAASDTTLSRSRAGIVAAEGIELGWLGLPPNNQDGNYGLALSDNGKTVRYNGAGGHTYTIPANGSISFPAGACIFIPNITAGQSLTIAITSDTLRFWGTNTTGSFSIGPRGAAVLYKAAATTWYIGGVGISSV